MIRWRKVNEGVWFTGRYNIATDRKKFWLWERTNGTKVGEFDTLQEAKTAAKEHLEAELEAEVATC